MSQIYDPTVPPAAVAELRSAARADVTVTPETRDSSPSGGGGPGAVSSEGVTIARIDARRQAAPPRVPRAGRDRLGIVVDSEDLLGAAITLGFTRVDYARLVDDIVRERSWVGVACVARPLTGAPLDEYLAYLQWVGLHTTTWGLPVVMGRGKVRLDTLVVREAMRLLYSERLTELCLLAGNGAYWVLGEECAKRGVKFTVGAVAGSLSGALRNRARAVFDIGAPYLQRVSWEVRAGAGAERRGALTDARDEP